MPFLDLNALPPALQASLGRIFDNDESRRRAVLAPWARAGFTSICPDAEWAWDPWRSFWRRKWAKGIRAQSENEFFALQQDAPYQGIGEPPPAAQPQVSIFDPSLPFFPTPLTDVRETMLSPWPDVITHAEFWAFAAQLSKGNAASTASTLECYLPRLRKVTHPTGLQRLRPWARSAAWRDIVWRTEMANTGMFS
ncbi:MAG: hypothetical protein HYY98_08560 [Burkholderiales bacterium]|nr:hypothetical protein [Burkholderiales bacterium]